MLVQEGNEVASRHVVGGVDKHMDLHVAATVDWQSHHDRDRWSWLGTQPVRPPWPLAATCVCVSMEITSA